MNRNKQVYELVLTSIIGAIILFLAIIPNVGFIQILPGVAVTIMHIPVIVGVFLLSLKYSLVLGFLFGLGSFIVALTRPATPFDMAFQNPLISILPRVLFAGVAFYIAKGFKKLALMKFGKLTIFGIISVVSAVGLFFGVNQITSQFTYRKHTDTTNEINQLKGEVYLLDNKDEVVDIISDAKNNKTAEKDLMVHFNISINVAKAVIDLNLDEMSDLELTNAINERNSSITTLESEVDGILTTANENFRKARMFTIPISIVLIIGLVVLYYIFTLKRDHEHTYVSSVFILATLAHTVLVIGSVVIFNPQSFKDTFGDQNILLIIYMIAAFNGIVEAFVGAVIGTPVATASLLRQERD